MADPLPVLPQAASDIAGNGGHARVWAFDARPENGTPLLIHAKFALAYRQGGYLGAANMTRRASSTTSRLVPGFPTPKQTSS